MITQSLVPWMCVAAFAALLVTAAIWDVRHYVIPHWISPAIVGLFGLYLVGSGFAVSWEAALIAGGAVFVVGACFFAFGAIGGGDVKLLAATALWAGLDELTLLLLATVLVGGVLALGSLMFGAITAPRPAGRLGAQATKIQSAQPAQLPYGVAIAVGGVLVAGMRLGV